MVECGVSLRISLVRLEMGLRGSGIIVALTSRKCAFVPFRVKMRNEKALNNTNTFSCRLQCYPSIYGSYNPIRSVLSRKHSTIAGARFSIGTLN